MADNTQKATSPLPPTQGQTTLGRSVNLKGELSGNEDLLIEGQFEGTVNVQDHCLTIGAQGQVKAEIQARQVIVFGTETGDVTLGAVTESPAFPVLFTFAVLLFFEPLKTRLQALVDRVFFRTRYDGAKLLARVGAELAATLQRGRILALVRECVGSAIPNAGTRLFVDAAGEDRLDALPVAVVARLGAGAVVTAFDRPSAYPDAASHEAARAGLARLGVEIAVPLLLGHELVGASRRMLDLAREHALDRIQFGRPIATFQAVRHRLADTLVAVEMAEAMLDAAWLDGSPLTASMAKAVAGRSARTASRHCQQVLAGIGFTTEHPFHLSARRVLVLDQLLGSSKVLTKRLGDELLRTRQLPPLLPL